MQTTEEHKETAGNELLSSDEAATLCGYSHRNSFMRAVRNHAIPHIRFNARRIRFDREQLAEWMKRRTVGGAR
jgi:excisionase family DNA binding protein